MADNDKDGKTDSSSEKSGDPSDPGPGKDRVTPDGRGVAEVMAENKRKAEKIQELESKIEEMDEMKERLKELEDLEEKRKLTQKEKEEKSDLQDDIVLAVRELRADKKYAPWIKIAQEESENAVKAARKALFDMDVEKADEFLEDHASQLGITVKELVSKLVPFVPKYRDRRPSRRNELAFRDWQKADKKEKELSEREKALKDKEDQAKNFREGGGSSPMDNDFAGEFDQQQTKADRLRVAADMVTGRNRK